MPEYPDEVKSAALNVRPYEEGDVESIARIGARAWEAGYAAILPTEVLRDRASISQMARRWRTLLARADVAQGTALALIGNRPVAFATAAKSRDDDSSEMTGEVFALNVEPDHWGRGIGSALMTSRLQHLRAVGFNEATLWVYADNVRARELYERLGFRVESGALRRVAEAPRLKEVRYRRALAIERVT